MAPEAEARHIGCALQAKRLNNLAARLVKPAGPPVNQLLYFRAVAELGFQRCCQNAGADGLCEQQVVAGPKAPVGGKGCRIDNARHRQAVFDLFVLDAVAACHYSARLTDLVHAAFKNPAQNLLAHRLNRKADNVHGRIGLAAHGIDIGQGIGRGNLPEPVGIVDDGRQKVEGLHERLSLGKAHNSRILIVAKAGQ